LSGMEWFKHGAVATVVIEQLSDPSRAATPHAGNEYRLSVCDSDIQCGTRQPENPHNLN
jgi:hypothetical protein